ncbi:hypothetical protein RTG_03321 [Rhodotorula toruloides ATCC 204091]|uniref:GAR domain-containing protein n=1 Tax=Rhodotorula toruloides TaxID=5286 RepID=A0A0K3CUR5_RHOTO|nr:hypothetical protein RTG_03321 [Rhodotorula toruloides ATCC 204091]
MDSAHTLKPRTSTASLSRLTDSTNTHHAPSTSLYTSSSPLKPSLAPHTPTGSRALPQSTSTASDLAGQLADLSLDEGSTSAIGGEEGEQRREQADRADGGVADKGSSGGEGAVHDGTTMNGTNGSSARNASSTRPSNLPSLLSVSSSITELLMEIQEVNTLIFEIQELRHATSMSASTSKNGASGAGGTESVSEVDAALMRLEAKLEAVRGQYTTLASQVEPLLNPGHSAPTDERGELDLLRHKWVDTVGDWEAAQKDADVLGEELKEDKWLVVFRTVSAQAEDMMRSLEKVVAQGRSFLDSIPSPPSSSSYSARRGLSRSPSEPVFPSPSLGTPSSFAHLSPSLASSLLSTLTPLLSTLHTKSSYYAPATDRVLRILEKDSLSLSRSTTRPIPPRPSKSLKRLVSDSSSTPPRTPSASFSLSHRRSMSTMSASLAPYTADARRQSLRPVSPSPFDSRPRWNVATRSRDSAAMETLASPAPTPQRPAPRSGRVSAAGLVRPASRASMSARAPSPAFSDASVSARPETPSRIPRPRSSIAGAMSPGSRRQSGAFGFGGGGSEAGDAGLRRALSPTPGSASRPPLSSKRYSLSRSVGMPSRISRPTSPALSTTSSSFSFGRSQTPEPSLMAQAQRIASIRAPPPVPKLPASYRPRSSLAPSRSTTPAPSDDSYVPNPLDPLDLLIAQTISSLPLALSITRIDPPLSRTQAATVELFQSRYSFALPGGRGSGAVMLKLVDRVGPRAKKGEKKVLVRVGGGWQDLEAFALALLAGV